MGSPGGDKTSVAQNEDTDSSEVQIQDSAIECPKGYEGDCVFDEGRIPDAYITAEIPDTDESLHYVKLEHSFYMMINEVTQRYFHSVTGWNPSSQIHPLDDGIDYPVDTVNWFDAVVFANLVSLKEGLPECYHIENMKCESMEESMDILDTSDLMACFEYQSHITEATVTLLENQTPYECQGMRLPTEAEWEYAARAFTLTPYYNGRPDPANLATGEDKSLSKIAWYDDYTVDEKIPEQEGPFAVRQKEPNQLGLYDMLGNLHEWVFDTYRESYLPEDRNEPNDIDHPIVNPFYYAPGQDNQIIRGGGWATIWIYCRAANRISRSPDSTGIFNGQSQMRSSHGFRLVRTVVSSE